MTGRRRGWAAEPSFRSPHRMGSALREEAPEPQPGAFSFVARDAAPSRAGRGARDEAAGRSGQSGGLSLRAWDRVVQRTFLSRARALAPRRSASRGAPARIASTSSSSSRPMRRPTMPRTPPARKSTPRRRRFGRRARTPSSWPRRITRGDEVVHLAHVPAELLAELGVLVRLAQRLHPELGHLELAVADRHVAAAHRLERLAHVWPSTRAPAPSDVARLPPHVVERGEIEVALRREVAVEDRLGDARRARDLRRRRAAVAAVGEDADRGLDQRARAARPQAGVSAPSSCRHLREVRVLDRRLTSGRARPRRSPPRT